MLTMTADKGNESYVSIIFYLVSRFDINLNSHVQTVHSLHIRGLDICQEIVFSK